MALAMAQEGETTLGKLIARVESYEDASYEARKLAERDRDYYDTKQLTREEEEELRRRGQPPIVFNRIKRKVDFLTGAEKNKRVDPKGFPRNPQDEGAANAASDALRYVARNNDFDQVRSAVYENMLIEGAGGAEVTVRPKVRRGRLMQGSALDAAAANFEEHEIIVNWYPWDRIGWDPASRRHDFSDANYLFTVVWKDLDEAQAKWPNPEDQGALQAASLFEGHDGATFGDRPQRTFWTYPDRRRVKIVMMYHNDPREGWSWVLFTKGGVIERGVSPFLDEDGEPMCPLEFASAYVDRDNNRYGVVRDMISPQDEINKRRSKLLHMLTMRQVVADESAVQDQRKTRRELAKADGYIEVTPGSRFELLQNGDQAAGQFSLLDQSMAEMDLMGPNAAMQGKGPQDQSGRAILAQQQGGMTEIATIEDRLRHWTLRMYRQMWLRVQQYWTEERWIRVTDNEQNIQFVGLNRPVTAGEVFMRELQAAVEQGALTPEQAQAEAMAAQQDPRAAMPIGVENNVAELMIDIVLDEAPDTVTIQHEQFQNMVELVRAGVPIPPTVLLQMAPGLRNRQEILDQMTGGNDPQAQQQQQMEMRAAELELMVREAEAMERRAKAEKTIAEIRKVGAETEKTTAEVEETLTQAAENEASAAEKLAGIERDDAGLLIERRQRDADRNAQAQRDAAARQQAAAGP